MAAIKKSPVAAVFVIAALGILCWMGILLVILACCNCHRGNLSSRCLARRIADKKEQAKPRDIETPPPPEYLPRGTMSERVELDEHKKHDDGLDDVFVIGDDEETLYEESATPADPHRSTFCATKSISEEYFKGENRQTVPSDADSLPKWQAGEESAHHSSALEPDDFEPGWDTERPPTGNPYGAPWAIKGDAAESKEAQGKVPFGCRPPSSIYGAPPPTPKVGRSLLRS